MASYDDPNGCNAVLIPGLDVQQLDDTEQLALLDIVNQANYTEMARKAGGSLTVPISGVPISLGGNYATFDATRTQLFQQHGYQSDQRRSHQALHSSLDPSQIEAWTRCKLKHQNDASSLKVEAKWDANSVVVTYHWDPQVIGGKAPSATVTENLVTGGYRTNAPTSRQALMSPTTLAPNDSIVVHYTRKPHQDFELVVNTNVGQTAQLLVPCVPPTKVASQALHQLTVDSTGGICVLTLKDGKFCIDASRGFFGFTNANANPPGRLPSLVHTFEITNAGRQLHLSLQGPAALAVRVQLIVASGQNSIDIDYDVQQGGPADVSINGKQPQGLTGQGTATFTLP